MKKEDSMNNKKSTHNLTSCRMRDIVKSNRSQSEVITTVLIILLVLSSVFIVYVVIRNMLKEGTERASTAPLDVSLMSSSTSLFQNPVNVSVTRGAGEGNLSAVIVIFKELSGAEACKYENTTYLPGELETVVYHIDLYAINCAGTIHSYEVYPILKRGIIGLKAAIQTQNNYVPLVTGEVIETVSGCRVLNVSNTVYTLQNNVFNDSTCFTIQANNVALDLNGYNITGYGLGGIGVFVSGYNQTTIKNGIIINFSHGIALVSSSNNTLTGMTTNLNNFGIKLESSSNNILTDTTANSNNQGIYIWSGLGPSSNTNTLTDITTNSNLYTGISLSSSSNNQLTGITATGNSRGINLDTNSNKNTLTSITANGNSFGIFLQSNSTNNILTNINANSNGNNGITFSANSTNNILTNITANSNTWGIWLQSSSNNNILTNITANSNKWGITLESSSNNTLIGITANSNYYSLTYHGGGVGIYLQSSSNNKINSTTACGNSQQDFSCSGSSGTSGTGNVFGSGKVTTCLSPYWPNATAVPADYTTCPL